IAPLIIGGLIYAYVNLSGNPVSYNANAWYFTLPMLLILWLYAFGMQRRLYSESFPLAFIKAILLVIAFGLAVLAYRFFLFITTLMFI
ncbi:MAG: hypothetical protein ACPF9D_13465, partial [Owenweeksia sp.]